MDNGIYVIQTDFGPAKVSARVLSFMDLTHGASWRLYVSHGKSPRSKKAKAAARDFERIVSAACLCAQISLVVDGEMIQSF